MCVDEPAHQVLAACSARENTGVDAASRAYHGRLGANEGQGSHVGGSRARRVKDVGRPHDVAVGPSEVHHLLHLDPFSRRVRRQWLPGSRRPLPDRRLLGCHGRPRRAPTPPTLRSRRRCPARSLASSSWCARARPSSRRSQTRISLPWSTAPRHSPSTCSRGRIAEGQPRDGATLHLIRDGHEPDGRARHHREPDRDRDALRPSLRSPRGGPRPADQPGAP